MQKKFFAFGYLQVVLWFLVWTAFSFMATFSANIYRNAVVALYSFNDASVLRLITIIGIIGVFAYLLYPRLINKFGAKNVCLCSLTLLAVIYFVIPFTSAEWLSGVLQALVMVVGSCAVSCTMMLVSKWFPRTSGRVMGIITAVGIVVQLICVPLFNQVLMASGIKMAMGGAAVILAIFIVICIFVMKERPEDVNLLPDNKPMSEEEANKLAAAKNVKSDWNYRMLLRTPRFWIASIGWGLTLLFLYAFSNVSMSFLLEKGWEQTPAVTAISFAGITGCLWSIASGFLDTKLGVHRAGVITIALQFIACILAVLSGSPAIVMSLIAYYLIMSSGGAPNNLFASQVLQLFGNKSYAVAYGLFMTICNLLQKLGPFFVSVSLDITGTYSAVFWILGGMSIISMILVYLGGRKEVPLPTKKETV